MKTTKLNTLLLVFIIGIYILLSFLTGKLLNPILPITIAVVIFLIWLILCIKGTKKNWQTISAIATLILAIVTTVTLMWAIFEDDIKKWRNRPILDISFFEIADQHLIRDIDIDPYQLENGKAKERDGWFIALQLTNKGKTSALKGQPVLTNFYTRVNAKWQPYPDQWIPITLRWALLEEGGVYIEKRELIPNRPEIFYLGCFSELRAGRLFLKYPLCPRRQPDKISAGEHCFEIMAYAVGAKPERKYIYIKFEDYNNLTDLQEIKAKIKEIKLLSHLPE